MSLRFVLGWLFLGVSAWAQSPGVRITWIGQACFYVETADGAVTMVTDPPVASVGYALPAKTASVVTISHNHTDHNNSAGVRGNVTLVDGRPVTARQETTAAGLSFILIPGFHDNQGGTARGPNTIARWSQGGMIFAHFGDYGQDSLTSAQLADLQGLDVIFVPAGGFFTIDAQRAMALIAQLNPRVAILMHFRTALGGPSQLAGLPAVAGPFPEIVYQPSSVVLDRAGLPASTQVWLMEPAAEAATVNAASFTAGAPVAPGSLASAFGIFTGSATQLAAAIPLPRILGPTGGQTEVLMDGAAVPLLYASPGQINFQVPRRTAVGQSLLEVRVGGRPVARGPLTVIPVAPGIFAALNQDGRRNAASLPARRGEVLQIFASGQGEVTPAVEDGAAAGGPPPSVTASLPEVSVGGKRAAVQFSGLTPGLVGLWQINAAIPADAPVGSAVSLVVNQGLRSNAILIAVE